jgi:hypothetical protein
MRPVNGDRGSNHPFDPITEISEPAELRKNTVRVLLLDNATKSQNAGKTGI